MCSTQAGYLSFCAQGSRGLLEHPAPRIFLALRIHGASHPFIYYVKGCSLHAPRRLARFAIQCDLRKTSRVNQIEKIPDNMLFRHCADSMLRSPVPLNRRSTTTTQEHSFFGPGQQTRNIQLSRDTDRAWISARRVRLDHALGF